MTQELILDRKKKLEAAREKAIGEANLYTGAIQECDHWLEQLKKAESEQQPQHS